MISSFSLETRLAKGTVSKSLKGLELKGFIRTHNDSGVRRYLIRDARLAVSRLRELNAMDASGLEEVNELLEQLNQPVVADPLRKRTAKPS